MTNNNKNTGFITDAFIGALKKNEEMNKNGIVKKEEAAPVFEESNSNFITDAFLEALKINEERNKQHGIRKDKDTDK